MTRRSLPAFACVPALAVLLAASAAGGSHPTRPVRSAQFAHAKERVLFSFLGFNGAYPHANVALDSAGNVYGTTEWSGAGGGSQGHGIVYQLSPSSRGKWQERILHRFGKPHDGIFPDNPVTVDALGNVYGTVSNGGRHNGVIVFELSPLSGSWRYKIIHAFDGNNGSYPASGVTIDAAGNLYGTTVSGGPGGSAKVKEGAGVVYELERQQSGAWTDKRLYVFNVDHSLNPNSPYGGVLFGGAGTIYGTTSLGGVVCALGGAEGCGTAFALTLSPRHLEVLHKFYKTSQDGAFPETSLIADAAGNLYGATAGGGPEMGGVIFELSRNSRGKWKETILRTFGQGGPDGYGPGGLVFDKAGNLYGTQAGGGRYGGGVLFVMSPTPSGTWTYTVVYNFGNNQDASGPLFGSLAFDSAGNLYGATGFGGEDNVGAVYEVTP